MLKLEAVLVAMTVARPWRSGWSLEHGVDFVVWRPTRRTIAAQAETGRVVAGERVSFLEADNILPSGLAVVRRYVSLAARAEAEAAVETAADRPLTRAWSSMARKAAGS